ncbi:MAG: hypothetical protein A2Y64_07995 [Candidatus Coatesbacteria bacterium RBG_13_66_14]|uniref:Uncharacterized protein n=1 Tax=Candidatus Coatesbacteria bacterium RBG_13_66_14 TaxID=1817816 RepID=A0A1F5FIX9_9BACT|nr:MAG: hypothetical protein A2Y64_07995 [Candidatus Coatesbacteria bacterium RBG_13_66_14]
MLCSLPFTGCRDGDDGGFALEVSYEGGYSSVVLGWYSLTPSSDGESVEFRHGETDIHGITVEYVKILARADLEDVYRVFTDNDVWDLPSSDLATATDQHTYTVTIRSGDREHTFSVYGPQLHPDARYGRVISPLVELGDELGPPEEYGLTMRVEGGLSRLDYSLYTVRLEPDRAGLVVEEKERLGGLTTRELDIPRSAALRLYLALAENDFWELGDSRAAEKTVTDIPTYTLTLDADGRSHFFSVYAPAFDPDPRYGSVTGAVYDLASQAFASWAE